MIGVFQYYDSIQWRSCISRAIVTSRRTSCINAREVIVLKKIFTHVLFLAVLLMGAVPAHAAVQINSTSFPDEAFRTLVQKFDTSKDGALSDSEISAVTEIDCEKNKPETNQQHEYSGPGEQQCHNSPINKLQKGYSCHLPEESDIKKQRI